MRNKKKSNRTKKIALVKAEGPPERSQADVLAIVWPELMQYFSVKELCTVVCVSKSFQKLIFDADGKLLAHSVRDVLAAWERDQMVVVGRMPPSPTTYLTRVSLPRLKILYVFPKS